MPPAYRDGAYEDAPQPIGHGQTVSQPYIVAFMTQALALTSRSRVLEIGTGSGYQTAVLAQLTPHVWSVECRPALGDAAARRLFELGYSVRVRIGDGCLGWPEHAPYDAIVVTAAGVEVPPPLVEQLAEGGRLVMPLGKTSWDQSLWLFEKRGRRLKRTFLAEVRFVPLVSVEDESGPAGPEPE